MLSQLSIKNLATIKKTDLSFNPGMSSITGETGAGKSILLRALNLVLGSRADSTLVRNGENNLEVSAVFDVENNKKIQAYLKDESLDADGECILRRIITKDGRSKAFVNGVSTPLTIVRNVGEKLIDMHSQNEHQLLLRYEQQLSLLDGFAQTDELCSLVNDIFRKHKDIDSQIDSLQDKQDIFLEQRELYSHQLDELTLAEFDEQELTTIEADFKKSANAKALIEKTAIVLNQLENDTGINSQLLSLNSELSVALDMDTKLSAAAELLTGAQLQTQEGIYELTNYLNNLSIDDKKTAQLEERLSELYNLARKHNCQIPELLEIKQSIETKLNKIESDTNLIDKLKKQKEKLAGEYKLQATKLGEKRTKAAIKLSSLVTKTIRILGMPGGEFKAKLQPKEKGVFLNGAETVNFLIKTNIGQEFKLLKKAASGGELSRISLAISVVSSSSEYTPTVVFDEVDVGISGAVAEIVGQKLKALSEHYQVVCITHLAQVASFGHQHLVVKKTQDSSSVQTVVSRLSAADRVNEIARILGGKIISDKTLKAAKEMINNSSKNQHNSAL